MRLEVGCVQQDDSMNEYPGNSSFVSVGCQTDLTLADLNELEAALVKVKDLETAFSAAKKS